MYLDPNSHDANAIANQAIQNLQEQQVMQCIDLMKPNLSRDGDQFCYLLGDNLHDGVAGFGDTIWQAALNFHIAIWGEKAKLQPQSKINL